MRHASSSERASGPLADSTSQRCGDCRSKENLEKIMKHKSKTENKRESHFGHDPRENAEVAEFHAKRMYREEKIEAKKKLEEINPFKKKKGGGG